MSGSSHALNHSQQSRSAFDSNHSFEYLNSSNGSGFDDSFELDGNRRRYSLGSMRALTPQTLPPSSSPFFFNESAFPSSPSLFDDVPMGESVFAPSYPNLLGKRSLDSPPQRMSHAFGPVPNSPRPLGSPARPGSPKTLNSPPRRLTQSFNALSTPPYGQPTATSTTANVSPWVPGNSSMHGSGSLQSMVPRVHSRTNGNGGNGMPMLQLRGNGASLCENSRSCRCK